jgi:chaperonin GroES
VRAETLGVDPDGQLKARAERVSGDMSWQVRIQDKNWKPGHDKMLLNLSIVGTAFKKSYYKADRRHNASELVLAKNLVLDYWSTSVEGSPRKTHIIPMQRNEIRDAVLAGRFRDFLDEAWFQGIPPTQTTTQQAKQDLRQGVSTPPGDETTSFQFGEQHVILDLDGDGYAEPWAITFDLTTGEVARIVARFEWEDIEYVESGKYRGEILRIQAIECFTKYGFIPSPDGGIYDIGFGVFLGPLNESVNSLINQLIDAGTMQTTAGGFLAKGAKMRGGAYTFAPFQWNRVDSTGDDLRKNIFPLPINEPSMVLFQLLSLLINYTNRISGATDMVVGENPGQNTPAETSRTMVEMGTKIYNAIFERVWWSMKGEFEKLYVLNRKYGPIFDKIGPFGSSREDYLPAEDGVVPAADPNITSDTLAVQLATAVKQAAMTTPGYNKDEVERNWLKAMKVAGIETLFPGSEGQEPPKDPKLVIAEMKLSAEQARLEWDKQAFVMQLMEDRELNQATIMSLMAKAQSELANAQSEGAYARVAEIQAMISIEQEKNNALDKRINAILKSEDLRIKEKQVDKKEVKSGAE